MKTIWKSDLAITDEQIISIPKGAKYLTIQMQRGMARLWYLADSLAPLVDTYIFMLSTGHPADQVEGCEFVDTFQLPEIGLVYHVFVLQPE